MLYRSSLLKRDLCSMQAATKMLCCFIVKYLAVRRLAAVRSPISPQVMAADRHEQAVGVLGGRPIGAQPPESLRYGARYQAR
ncbi:hypothetical protein DOTSEDRAFT_46153 [Dothistroma septosporum NZE10]|uniref:Uncharacterized protein n=1 Tax=Dothistroma septosporum (strain NZE10 / CBS 128990) TaxID=675120 RepID=N1PJW6_DOTSN|nr:hypothetical protein DOTSEDRAFT_46153 [Dothistroma septosporum NZE10]